MTPQKAQGRCWLFGSDASTLAIVSAHARAMREID
jgi:aminopeptidase C